MSTTPIPHPSLVLTDEVSEALRDGAPVVALESTIISHGMPYPQNVEMATEVERIIREGGAVPATIAVLDGRPRIVENAEGANLIATIPVVAKDARLGAQVAREYASLAQKG